MVIPVEDPPYVYWLLKKKLLSLELAAFHLHQFTCSVSKEILAAGFILVLHSLAQAVHCRSGVLSQEHRISCYNAA